MIIRRETKQRQMVLQAVRARTDHPTADQIFNDVHKLDPKISHGTVYRNLNLLCEDGLLCHVRVPGADRYDLRTDLHYHMFCVRCKKVSDAPHPYKPYLDEEIAKQSGYKIIRHRLIFEGVCPDCQGKGIRPVTESESVRYPVRSAPQAPTPSFTGAEKPSRRK